MWAKLREIREELRWRRHHPIPNQGRWLQQVVRGFFNYHAVPTNMKALLMFRYHVTELWWQALRPRSHRDKTTCERARKIADDWLPKPQILHPWPSQRFAVKHPRWEPYAGSIHPIKHAAVGLSGVTRVTTRMPTAAYARQSGASKCFVQNRNTEVRSFRL